MDENAQAVVCEDSSKDEFYAEFLLNEQQLKFVKAYVLCWNQTKAAIEAGYSSHSHSARTQGYRMLQNVDVRKAIEKEIQFRRQNKEIAMERIRIERERIAHFDYRSLFDEKGKLKKIHELDEDAASAVQSIEYEELPAQQSLDLGDGEGSDKPYVNKAGEIVTVSEGKQIKIKLYDKNAALTALEKMYGMYKPETLNVNVTDKLAERVERARGRNSKREGEDEQSSS